MAALRRSGQYDRSLVVVMADHGVSFTPGSPHRAVRASNLPEIASIPLFIKGPGQRRGRVVNTNVRSIDVLPTIAARLGTHLPWSTDGRSADRAPDGGTVTLERSNEGGSLSLPFDRYVSRRDGLIGRMVSDLRLDSPTVPSARARTPTSWARRWRRCGRPRPRAPASSSIPPASALPSTHGRPSCPPWSPAA